MFKVGAFLHILLHTVLLTNYSYCQSVNYSRLNINELTADSTGAWAQPPVPSGLLEISDEAVSCLKQAWNLTEIFRAQSSAAISEFWRQLKLALTPIHSRLKENDRRIIQNRPSVLMNKLLDLQELSDLRSLSSSFSTNPIIKWRVKWIELSSLGSHIHRLYNKRMRDIMNDEPYIKTVATSIYKYMGTPWYSRLSGNLDKTFRQMIKTFPDQIKDRISSDSEGDLFVGLRTLIDENPTAKSGSAMEYGDCLGSQEIGKIVPSTFESPIYVLYYIAMVDIKYYILMNFFHIYELVYENVPIAQHVVDALEADLRRNLKKKIDLYTEAFVDKDEAVQSLVPVEPGYFRCDPPPISDGSQIRSHTHKISYIKVTNFLKVFVAPEKRFKASQTCRGTCDMFDGTRPPCNETDTVCIEEFEEECFYNPDLCAGFKPPCPIEDTICINSGTAVSYCPSNRHDRLLEWTKFDDKSYGDQSVNCSMDVVELRAHWEMEHEVVMDTPAMCEVCMCHCFSPIGENTESVRTFSLKPALASVQDNSVVVGVKFQQVEDQIHFMVAEAHALPNYQVDMSTVKWRKPKAALVDSKPPQVVQLRRNLRIIHLDDLTAPPEHVVTGIRWVEGSYEGVYLHEYIGIQIQATKIDVATGKLIPKTSKWIGNENNTLSREPYNYVDPDDPVKADGPALPDSSRNQFLTFRATSVDKDLGQNAIPYFDAQRTILDADKSGWLKGLGIFHKGRPSFGGFLAMKLIKYQDGNYTVTTRS